MPPKFFLPQAALDQWIVSGAVDLQGAELVVVDGGRRFDAEEAVRVVAELTGAGDPHEIVGRVQPVKPLTEKGAEILEGSMIWGDNAYDVVAGFMAAPQGGPRDGDLACIEKLKAALE